MQSSSNAAAAADNTATVQQPPRKKQKVRRKAPPPPPPAETIARLPEESKLQTPLNASVHGSGFLSETRLTHRTDTTSPAMMPRQMQFIFSPRPPHPISRSETVPGEARFPTSRSDGILHRLRPIQQNNETTGIYRNSSSRNEMDNNNSISELVASLPIGSSSLPLHHYASMSSASSSPPTLEEMNYRSHLRMSSLLQSHNNILPDGTIAPVQQQSGFHTSEALRSLVLRSSRTHQFAAQHSSNIHAALAASQSMGHTINMAAGTATNPLLIPRPTRNANQILEDMLRQQQQQQQQEPQVHHDQVMDALVAAHASESAATTTEEQRQSSVPRTTPTTSSHRQLLPVIMGHSSDILQMNDHQAYLRQQIEVFQATQEDLYANTRGRNKRIHVGQVGIRCRHCAHVPARQRQKGTVYFPATMRGLYQAAQNMSTNHIQCGLCTEMPNDVKAKFVELWPTKNRVSRAGARYWEAAARRLGLVDTEDGIAFQPNPPGP